MEATPQFTPLIRGRLIGASSADGTLLDVGGMIKENQISLGSINFQKTIQLQRVPGGQMKMRMVLLFL